MENGFPRSLERLEHIRIVFEILRKNSLKQRVHKCTFGQKETTYLGLIVGNCTAPEKIKAVKDWPLPTTQKNLSLLFNFAGIMEGLYIIFLIVPLR